MGVSQAVTPTAPASRHTATARAASWALPLALFALFAGGCQSASPVTHRRLIEHQAMIDFSGLKPAETYDALKISCAVPRQWEALPLKRGALYAHQQWKSPSTHTGAGVVYVRLPFPLSEKTLLWFAKREYTKGGDDGRLIDQWTDEIGREWFEAENNKYHVRGYAIVRGFNAWMVYFGTKTGYPPDVAELSLAARCVETFLPDPKRSPRRAADSDEGESATIAADSD